MMMMIAIFHFKHPIVESFRTLSPPRKTRYSATKSIFRITWFGWYVCSYICLPQFNAYKVHTYMHILMHHALLQIKNISIVEVQLVPDIYIKTIHKLWGIFQRLGIKWLSRVYNASSMYQHGSLVEKKYIKDKVKGWRRPLGKVPST